MSKKILFSLLASILLLSGCAAPAKIQKIIDAAVNPEATNQGPATESPAPTSTATIDIVKKNVVRWQKPEEISSLKFFVSVPSDKAYEDGGWQYAEISGGGTEAAAAVVYYRVGTFEYQGKPSELIAVKAWQNGMLGGDAGSHYFFAKNNQGITLLAGASSKLADKVTNGIGEEGLVRSLFTIDTTTIPSDLVLPSELYGALPRQEAVLKETLYFDPPVGSNTPLQPVFTDTQGHVLYGNTRNGFDLINDSPLVAIYALQPDFFDKDNLVPQITWTNGEINKSEYSYVAYNGCGSTNYLRVVDPKDISVSTDLVVVGKNNLNDPIYELKDTSHQRLKDLYKNFPTEPKLTYEQFLATRPLLYWVDPFGRLVELRNNKFQPQAECGKPVIYLYPKKTTNVSVNVSPQGGLTYSEPPLKDGWEVAAEPNGNLTEIKTGKYFPYLFWEGRGDIYEQPKLGWVVKKAGVKQFLQTKLAQLGLKRSEISDFLDFWLPKMQDNPYYFVTFLGNATMDKLAPLTVSPAPDTVIRILMDFTPLDKPIAAKGFTIRTPKRKGFTVVEWGGVVR